MRMDVFVLCLAGLTLPVFAEEKLPLLKVGSQTYSNVTVTTVSATDIYFVSSQGMGNAKLKDIDPALQKHFHYDPAKVQATEQKPMNAADKWTVTINQQTISAWRTADLESAKKEAILLKEKAACDLRQLQDAIARGVLQIFVSFSLQPASIPPKALRVGDSCGHCWPCGFDNAIRRI
jgi:hypothetical protein